MFLECILSANDVVESINENMDYLLKIIPELNGIIGFEHNHPQHHLDVWKHTLCALSMSPNDFDIRLTLLLHDIGKRYSYQDEEVRHFRGHPKVSAQMSEGILKRLGFNEEYIKNICYLIEFHDTRMTKEQIDSNYELCLKLYEVQRCDALAHNPDFLEKRKKYLEETKLLLRRGE